MPDAREFCEDIALAWEEYECSDSDGKIDFLEEKVNYLVSNYVNITPTVTTVNDENDAFLANPAGIYGVAVHEPAGVAEEIDQIFDDIGRQ